MQVEMVLRMLLRKTEIIYMQTLTEKNYLSATISSGFSLS